MSERFDFFRALAYKSWLEGMEFRCSKAVAALILMMGANGGGFLAWPARAGDPIEFSAPAIPLAVPQPDVEIKEPAQTIGSLNAVGGGVLDPEEGFSTEVIVVRPRHKVSEPLEANPPREGEASQLTGDGWLTPQPETSHLANGSAVSAQRGEEAGAFGSILRRGGDSGLQGEKIGSRFGAQSDSIRENAGDTDRFGRPTSNKEDDSFWAKFLNRPPSAFGQASGGGFMSQMDESKSLDGGASEVRINNAALSAESTRTLGLPADSGSFATFEERRSRQADDQSGANQMNPGYVRAWEPPLSHALPPKSHSKLGEAGPSHGGAPVRPVTLLMPRRPGDPGVAPP